MSNPEIYQPQQPEMMIGRIPGSFIMRDVKVEEHRDVATRDTEWTAFRSEVQTIKERADEFHGTSVLKHTPETVDLTPYMSPRARESHETGFMYKC